MHKYDKYIKALRKCAKEHEGELPFTGHIIVSDLCRDVADLLEALEQQVVRIDEHIEKNALHTISEVICVKCCRRWIAARPSDVLLKELECPNCGQGYAIETGQKIEADDAESEDTK